MSTAGVIDTAVTGAEVAGATGFLAGKAGLKTGLGIAARVAFKAIPIIGWASLAYDGYQLANYAYDKYNETDSQAQVEILSPEEMAGREFDESTIQTGLGAETAIAATAVASPYLMSSKPSVSTSTDLVVADDSTSNSGKGGKTPKPGGKFGKFGKAGIAIAAWEAAAFVAEKLLEDDLDKQYNEAQIFEEDIVADLEASRSTPLSDVDHRIIQTMSMEYGKALSAYDGEHDLSEAEFNAILDKTLDVTATQMDLFEKDRGSMTLTRDEFKMITTHTVNQLQEGLQPDQHASLGREIRTWSPFD